MGLHSCPELLLVPGRVSPLVWAFLRRPRVVLPEALLQKLDETGTTALIAHELAHIRRKDHWVRHLELVTTAFFWWHPVLWWARYRIREAEEFCCDAHALQLSTGKPTQYAHTLVDTADFLSGTGRIAFETNLEGGSTASLKRRLTMIVAGTRIKKLSLLGQVSILLLALTVLPFAATLVQQPSQAEKPAPKAEPAPRPDPDPKEISEAVDKALKDLDIEKLVETSVNAAMAALEELDIDAIVENAIKGADIEHTVEQALREVEDAELESTIKEALEEARLAIQEARINETIEEALKDADIDATVRKALEEAKQSLKEEDIGKKIEEALKEIDVDKVVKEALEKAKKEAKSKPPTV
jgi:hypothetical protein